MHSHDRTLLARLGFADPDKGEPTHDLACQYLAQPEVLGRIVKGIVRPRLADYRESFNRERNYVIGRNQYGASIIGCATDRGTETVDAETLRPSAAQLEVPISKGSGQYKTTIGFVDLTFEVTGRYRECGETGIKKQVCVREAQRIPLGFRRRRGTVSRDTAWLYRGETVGPPDDEMFEYRDAEGQPLASGRDLAVPESCIDEIARWGGHDADGWQRGEFALEEKHESRMEWTPFDREGGRFTNTVAAEVKIRPTSVGDILRQINLYREYLTVWGWLLVTDFPLSPADLHTLSEARIHHLQLSQSFTDWAEEQRRAATQGSTADERTDIVFV